MKNLSLIIFTIALYIFSNTLLRCNADDTEKRKIAIIGAGIAGTSCALFLRDYFKDSVEIHIYEQADQIGGRLAPIEYNKIQFDLGRTFTSLDLYTNKLIDRFKLNKQKSAPYSIFYNDSGLWKINTWLEGWSSSKTFNNYLQKEDKNFSKVYFQLNNQYRFESALSLLDAADRMYYTSQSTRKYLQTMQVSKEWIDWCKCQLMINYGQSLENVPWAAGIMSLNRIWKTTYTVEEGAHQLIHKCWKESKAILHHEKVIAIQRPAVYHSTIISTDKNGTQHENEYLYVVVAAPLAENLQQTIKFEQFQYLRKSELQFKTTVTTIVEGTLKKNYFRSNSDAIAFVDSSAKNYNVEFILRLKPKKHNVWLIQSGTKLTKENLEKFFELKKIVKSSTESIGYPLYKMWTRESFSFATNLYYINGIESIGSTIEMSIMGAKNAANWILQRENSIKDVRAKNKKKL